MNRLSFLKGLAGLPIIAALAPLAFSGQQEAQSVSGGYISAVSTLSSSGSFSAVSTSNGIESVLDKAVMAAPGEYLIERAEQVPGIDIDAGETGSRFTHYAVDEAGDWEGYWESADRQVVTWIDKFGHVVRMNRVTGLFTKTS